MTRSNRSRGALPDDRVLASPSPGTDLEKSGHSTELAEASELARGYAAQARSEATLRAYQGDWRRFCAWCESRGVSPVPARAEHVAAYLSELASSGRRVSTIMRALSAISQAHGLAGAESPCTDPGLANVVRGIKRAVGTAQKGKRPLVLSDLAHVCEELPTWTIAVRDRALLLIGFAGGFRRSELVSLDVADLEQEERGIVAHLRRSKTDQEGAGRDVPIPYGSNPRTCPVRALRAWLARSGIEQGPVFRAVDRHGHVSPERLNAQSVAAVVKRWAEASGLDPHEFAGHSLRAGLATSAAAAGKSERAIMAQTGHRSYAMVRRYIRRATIWEECGAMGIGL